MRSRALFLHTGYRSAGTWIWQRFREQSGVVAFCEPLNDWLADATSQTLLEPRPEIWPSRHPSMRPYFAEYEPLLKTRGIAGYERRFAYDDFFAPASKRMPALASYLRSLCDFSHAQSKLPVLKFTRSLGRVEWMRQEFPDAAHIAVVRSPLSQYRSAAHLFTRGHRDFLGLPIALLALSAQHSVVRDVLSMLQCDLRSVRRRTLERTRAAAERFVKENDPGKTYRAYLAFWVATALTSMPFADVIIDAGHLHQSLDYRREVEQRLEQLSGFAISLDDVAAPSRDDVGSLMPSRTTIVRLHEVAQVLCSGFETHSDLIAAG